MEANTIVLQYAVTGESKAVSTPPNPVAADVVDAFVVAAGGDDVVWPRYFQMAPPDNSRRARPFDTTVSSTQVEDVRLFFRWCARAHAFRTTISVFVAGRETPLMPAEPVPLDRTVTLLPETTIPELTDAIHTLCLDVLPDVIRQKIAVEDQAREVRRLKKANAGAGAGGAGGDDPVLASADVELKRRQTRLRLHPSFIVALANGRVLREARATDVETVVERLRRFFVLLTREAKHCAHNAMQEHADRHEVFAKEMREKWGGQAAVFGDRGHRWLSAVGQLGGRVNEFRHDEKRFLLSLRIRFTGEETMAMLQEAYQWTHTYDAEGGALFNSRTASADGQIKTVLKTILYTARQTQRAVEDEKSRLRVAAWKAEKEARQAVKRSALHACAKTAADAYRRRGGDVDALRIADIKALAEVQFGVTLCGHKAALVSAFGALRDSRAWDGHLTADGSG